MFLNTLGYFECRNSKSSWRYIAFGSGLVDTRVSGKSDMTLSKGHLKFLTLDKYDVASSSGWISELQQW